MKISFDKDKLRLRIKVTNDKDLSVAEKLRKLKQDDKYQELKEYTDIARCLIEDSLKQVLSSEAHVRMAAYRAAAFAGFDEATGIIDQIIASADDYKKSKKAEMEEDYDGERDEDF